MNSELIDELVGLSGKFTDGDFSSDDGARLQAIVGGPMASTYRIPFAPTETLVDGHTPAAEDQLRGLWHELVQHLRDLRYLSEADFVGYHQRKAAILDRAEYLLPVVEAVSQYLPEDGTWEEGAAILPMGGVDLFWLSRHLPAITDRIGRFTSWDGALPTPANYRPGEENIFGRSLAYRVRTLSSPQFPFVATDYFLYGQLGGLNELFENGFAVRGAGTEKSLPIGYWRHLGDIDLLLRRYIRNADKRAEGALLYQLEDGEPAVVALSDLPDSAFELPRLDPDTYDIGQGKKNIRNARRRGERADDGLDVRLLQIKLWQIGYYVGAVDGEWGPVSHLALKTFIADEATVALGDAERPKKRERKRAARIRALLLPANRKNRVYVADLKGLIRLFDAPAQAPTLSDDIASDVERLQTQAGVSAERIDEKVLEGQELGQLYPNNAAQPERRVAFPRARGFRRLWGGIGKVLRWLKDTVVSAAEYLLGPVFTFVKRLLRPVRLAVTRFFTGFRYLANFVLGRPVVTDFPAEDPTKPAVRFATVFSLDFDARTLVPGKFEAGQAATHGAHLRRMRADMDYFLDTVVNMIRLISRLTQPGGWVWLGAKLFGWLRAQWPDGPEAVA